MSVKILFYVNYAGSPSSADYQHSIVACAEGLQKMNIPYHANVNYYMLKDGTYLFKEKKKY
tara:strand:- start:89 stop:271 length:183 start_codon:yes stop_codon:yes gene_type:complete